MPEGFKIKPTPSPSPGPKVDKEPGKWTGPGSSFNTTEQSQVDTLPDGRRKGFVVQKSGKKQFQDEIPYPPPKAPPQKPMKVK